MASSNVFNGHEQWETGTRVAISDNSLPPILSAFGDILDISNTPWGNPSGVYVFGDAQTWKKYLGSHAANGHNAYERVRKAWEAPSPTPGVAGAGIIKHAEVGESKTQAYWTLDSGDVHLLNIILRRFGPQSAKLFVSTATGDITGRKITLSLDGTSRSVDNLGFGIYVDGPAGGTVSITRRAVTPPGTSATEYHAELLEIKEGGVVVDRFDLTEAAYDSLAKLASAIDALDNWTGALHAYADPEMPSKYLDPQTNLDCASETQLTAVHGSILWALRNNELMYCEIYSSGGIPIADSVTDAPDVFATPLPPDHQGTNPALQYADWTAAIDRAVDRWNQPGVIIMGTTDQASHLYLRDKIHYYESIGGRRCYRAFVPVASTMSVAEVKAYRAALNSPYMCLVMIEPKLIDEFGRETARDASFAAALLAGIRAGNFRFSLDGCLLSIGGDARDVLPSQYRELLQNAITYCRKDTVNNVTSYAVEQARTTYAGGRKSSETDEYSQWLFQYVRAYLISNCDGWTGGRNFADVAHLNVFKAFVDQLLRRISDYDGNSAPLLTRDPSDPNSKPYVISKFQYANQAVSIGISARYADIVKWINFDTSASPQTLTL